MKSEQAQDRIISALINLATSQFGFSQARLNTVFDNITIPNNYSRYKKLKNRKIALAEYSLHEICHLIVEDNKFTGKNSDDRYFNGDLNELKVIALVEIVLTLLDMNKWSRQYRCKEAYVGPYNDFKNEMVSMIIRDTELNKQAKKLGSIILNKALDMTGNEYQSHLNYVWYK